MNGKRVSRKSHGPLSEGDMLGGGGRGASFGDFVLSYWRKLTFCLQEPQRSTQGWRLVNKYCLQHWCLLCAEAGWRERAEQLRSPRWEPAMLPHAATG